MSGLDEHVRGVVCAIHFFSPARLHQAQVTAAATGQVQAGLTGQSVGHETEHGLLFGDHQGVMGLGRITFGPLSVASEHVHGDDLFFKGSEPI